ARGRQPGDLHGPGVHRRAGQARRRPRQPPRGADEALPGPGPRALMADAMAGIRSRHPGLREAVVADARITAQHRFERHEFHGGLDTLIQVIRLMWVSDAFLAHALYRLKAALQRRGVPLLPRLAHKMA